MKKLTILSLIAFMTAFNTTNASAADDVFSVEFDSASPFKNISLKNAGLKIAIYSGGIPMG